MLSRLEAALAPAKTAGFGSLLPPGINAITIFFCFSLGTHRDRNLEFLCGGLTPF